MDYRSTLIRNVEIPSTLPSMETLTKLEGSIILKDVEQVETGVRIEGDLLWRGFFEEEGIDGGECLWEGAEYFAETIDGDALRAASPPLIEPRVVAIKGESLSDSTFRLAFDVRWYGQPENEEEYKEAMAKDSKSAECPCKQKAKKNSAETLAHVEASSEPEKKSREQRPKPIKTDFEEKLEDIDETWREKLKTLQKETEAAETVEKIETAETAKKRETIETTEDTETAETVEIAEELAPPPKRQEIKTAEKAEQEQEAPQSDDTLQCCPYSAYCLRYYRIQEGDELEKIAEKFSATVAKLKEYNALEDSRVKSGRLIRIP